MGDVTDDTVGAGTVVGADSDTADALRLPFPLASTDVDA